MKYLLAWLGTYFAPLSWQHIGRNYPPSSPKEGVSMSSINNILFSVQNMAPALLNVGGGSKGANYDSLAAINSSLFGTTNSSSNSLLNSLGLGGSNSSLSDKVSLNYKSIGNQIVSDMASVTAKTIKEFPELDGDYVIAIIDDGTNREARVYSRSEILDNFDGTEKEKKALEAELATNPLMVFANDKGLPETTSNEASQTLADNLNDFLKKNNKNFNTLVKAGYDPLTDMLGSSSMKKILAAYVGPQEPDEDEINKESSEKLLKDLKELIEEAAEEEEALKDDYVVAIIDDGTNREAKIYSRSAILDAFVGTEEEKEKLKKQLDANPLMVFLNDNGLSKSSEDGAFGELASAVNSFLRNNSEELDKLDKAGYDPLADILGDSSMKKALANYVSTIE